MKKPKAKKSKMTDELRRWYHDEMFKALAASPIKTVEEFARIMVPINEALRQRLEAA